MDEIRPSTNGFLAEPFEAASMVYGVVYLLFVTCVYRFVFAFENIQRHL